MPRDPAVRNTLAYALPEVFWGFAWALAIDHPLPAAFAKSFGASQRFLGTFGLVSALGIGIPMIFTGYLLSPWARKRGLLFWGHLGPAGVLGLLALAVAHTDDVGVHVVELLYLTSFFVFFFSIGILIPTWLGLLGDLFPDRHRTRVLGITFAMNRLGGLAGGTVAERFLSSSVPVSEQWSWIFGLAAAAMVVGSFPFLWIVEAPRTPRPRPPIRLYLGEVKALFLELRHLRRLIGIDMLGVTAVVIVLFYGDAGIRGHGIDASWAGAWSRTSAGAQLVVALAISFLGYRIAPRHWLIGGTFGIALAGVVASVAATPFVFAAVAALSGVWMVIRMTCHAPQVLRLAPGRDGTIPIALAWTATILVQGLSPFLAGLAIPSVGYAPAFLAVACLAFVCAILLWIRVPDHIPASDTRCNEE